jgi:hypothetical protein
MTTIMDGTQAFGGQNGLGVLRAQFASFNFPSKLICAVGSEVLCGVAAQG